jgi:hypothetical protein
MDIVHGGRMEWGENLAAQRAGRLAHKILFEGVENSPDNFLWALANEGSDYYSPRHRHPWDQVRLCLQGAIPMARDLKIRAGEVGYFPESVHYGPQEGGPDRLTLVLQMGGASGLGFLSAGQVRAGRERLLRDGVFDQGVYRRANGEGRKNEDAYEAIWRCVTGQPLIYPRPQYRAPIVMRPDAFAWRDVPGARGVRRKFLGTFPGRGLSLDFIALDAGAVHDAGASRDRQLIFVREGEGRCKAEPYFAQSAIRLEPGETVNFSASTATELFVITVPPVDAPPSGPRAGL